MHNHTHCKYTHLPLYVCDKSWSEWKFFIYYTPEHNWILGGKQAATAGESVVFTSMPMHIGACIFFPLWEMNKWCSRTTSDVISFLPLPPPFLAAHPCTCCYHNWDASKSLLMATAMMQFNYFHSFIIHWHMCVVRLRENEKIFSELVMESSFYQRVWGM